MAQRTIKLTSVSSNTSKQDLQIFFDRFSPLKMHIHSGEAYLQFQDPSAIQLLNQEYGDVCSGLLEGAKIEKVPEGFKWEDLKNSGSQIKSFIEESDEKEENGGETPIHLTKPDSRNLVVIRKCNENYLKKRSSEEIKKEVFGQFKSVNRILKQNQNIILEFSDEQEIPEFTNKFQGTVPELGSETLIEVNLSDIVVSNFAQDWIKQQSSQNQIKEPIEEEDEKCLHEKIIPKLEKETSIQAQFYFQEKKVVDQQKEMKTGEACFCLEDKGKEMEQKQQQEKRRMFEEKQREERQEKQRIQRQENQRLEREQRQRIQRQQKERIEKEQRERMEREQKERIERQRIQRQQKQRRQREEKQRIEREQMEKFQREQEERILRQIQQKQAIRIQQQKRRIQEAQERQRQEKKKQQAQRRQKQQRQRQEMKEREERQRQERQEKQKRQLAQKQEEMKKKQLERLQKQLLEEELQRKTEQLSKSVSEEGKKIEFQEVKYSSPANNITACGVMDAIWFSVLILWGLYVAFSN